MIASPENLVTVNERIVEHFHMIIRDNLLQCTCGHTCVGLCTYSKIVKLLRDQSIQ